MLYQQIKSMVIREAPAKSGNKRCINLHSYGSEKLKMQPKLYARFYTRLNKRLNYH